MYSLKKRKTFINREYIMALIIDIGYIQTESEDTF